MVTVLCIRLKDNSAPDKFRTSHFYQENLFNLNFDRFSFAFQTLGFIFKASINRVGVVVYLSTLSLSLFIALSLCLLF